MKVFQISELVNHLPPEYLAETQDEVNWPKIRGMRNRFAHDYIDMNYNVIFDTAVHDIPKLEKFIKKEIYKFNKKEKD